MIKMSEIVRYHRELAGQRADSTDWHMRVVDTLDPRPVMSATFSFELTNGNKGRGGAWFKKDKDRKQLERMIQRTPHGLWPCDFPAHIRITRVLGKGQRLWDEDSFFRGNAKEFIDSLVAVGIFHNDSPKFIKRAEGAQDPHTRPKKPNTKIEVFEWHPS